MSAVPKSEVIPLGDDDVRQVAPFVAQDVSAAEIYQQIATARQFPRVITNFQRKLRDMATIDEAIARQCTYSMKRGGKLIEGPSIRFAEMVLNSWGNAYVAVRPGTAGERMVTAQAVFWDLESNVKIGLESARRITKSNGDRYDDDMIVVTGNAAGSVALRNCILRGVPKSLYIRAHLDAQAVVMGDLKTLATKRLNALEWFSGVQVNEAQILAALGIEGIADITGAHLVTLGGFRTAIEDEGRDPEEIFPAVETKSSRAATKDRKGPPKAPTKPEASAAQSQPPGDARNDDTGRASASGPQSAESDGAARQSSRAGSTTGEADGNPAPASAAGAPSDSDPFAIEITDADSAARFAVGLKARIEVAPSNDAIDELHGRAVKSGQWRALQTHDANAYARLANAMAERSAAVGDG